MDRLTLLTLLVVIILLFSFFFFFFIRERVFLSPPISAANTGSLLHRGGGMKGSAQLQGRDCALPTESHVPVRMLLAQVMQVRWMEPVQLFSC